MNQFSSSRGSSLVITLAILILVTILAVGMVSMVRLERISARNVLETVQAKALADAAADHALVLIRDAISAAEQTVTNSVAGSGKFWVSQPGKITVFHSDGTIDTTSSRDLYSTNVGATPMSVDLNSALFDGSHPIITDDGSGNAPVMTVPWVNVLKDPSLAASATNQIIGRYAFWVDDESTKLNLNTADGSAKAGTTSFGPGTPAEMNLQALTNASAPLTAAEAANIANRSGAQYSASVTSRPLNSTREILQVPGISTNLYSTHSSDLTAYNRSSDLNLFGEPKINLAAVTKNTVRSLMSGTYADTSPHSAQYSERIKLGPALFATSQPLTWIYPSSGTSQVNSQLPAYKYSANGTNVVTTVRLPQFFHDEGKEYVSGYTGNNPPGGYIVSTTDYDMGMRIARYLKDTNSQGNPIQWPPFPGSDSGGFSGKYTDRQIDEISLQILTQLKQLHPDHYYRHTYPYFISRGFLSGKPVRGLSRAPRLTEVVLQVTTVAGDPPSVKFRLFTEYFLPKEFKGCDLTGDLNLWGVSVNFSDTPGATLGGKWADSLLQITDQNGLPAGVDLFGNRGTESDPDQTKAALYHHPWALRDPLLPHDPSTNPYMGSGPSVNWDSPALLMGQVFPGSSQDTTMRVWKIGDYHGVSSRFSSVSFPTKSGVTSITISGGLAIWLDDSSSLKIDAAPIDSVYPKTITDAASRRKILDAVIPIPGTEAQRTIPIPDQVFFHMQVEDPLVNAFPGDWQGRVATSNGDPDFTMPVTSITATNPQVYQNGQNTISRATTGGDALTAWWSEQNIATPKSSRFPSAGYLQYLHTGVMPDKENDAKPLREQKGTPWRLLNFSPSTAASQQTEGGESYPDWALLDLFTSPAIFQPLGDPLPPSILRTWGGATAGRLNPNAILLPFGIARTKPLEALFKGVSASTAYDSAGEPIDTTANETTLAQAVTSYVSGLGRPLMLPGEICNVPEIAAFVYQGVDEAARSRNDLVRQTVGNLSTRSNTFTVWAMGEVIKKKHGNTDYGIFESGDLVQGRSRMRYVIERYLDPGTDGIYGNSIDPGPDGTINTPDDPTTGATGAHPTMTYPLPYKYRIIATSQVE